MKITRMRAAAALIAVAAALTGAALARGGDAGTSDGVIHACRHPNGGWLRIPAREGACRPRERAVSWSVQGPKGDTGPQGEPGPAGPAGPKGDPGSGLTNLGELAGIPCTPEGGGSGTVELDTAGDDTVLIRCVGSEPPPPPGSSSLVINEVDYDQVGKDTGGFVEIENVGDAAADLAGIALVFVDGADSAEYRRQELTGTLEPGAYLVVDTDAQNGSPDGLALVDTGARTLLDALSYEGAITSAVIDGATFGLVEGSALPPDIADSNAVEGSLIRNPDGKDTDDAASDWAFTTAPTRGSANELASAG
jgi:Lamin Tail Domain